jgi:hypothetical protein
MAKKAIYQVLLEISSLPIGADGQSDQTKKKKTLCCKAKLQFNYKLPALCLYSRSGLKLPAHCCIYNNILHCLGAVAAVLFETTSSMLLYYWRSAECCCISGDQYSTYLC